MARTNQYEGGFDIYATTSDGDHGLVEVSDGLHRLILSNLSNRPMSTTEISELTGKAQSTLSVHLDQMVSQRLIRSEYDKNDSRRKVFSITSKRVASSKEPSSDGIEESNKYIDLALNNKSGFYKYLFKSVIMGAEANGLDVCPMMEMLGAQIAMSIVPKISSRKVEDVIKEIQDFYERNDLGEVCVYTFLPLTIIIHDSDESQHRFEAFASMSHGLFRTLLSQVIEREYKIIKSEIFGTGNNYYKFVIDLA